MFFSMAIFVLLFSAISTLSTSTAHAISFADPATKLKGYFNTVPFDSFYMVDSVGSETRQPGLLTNTDDPNRSHYSKDQTPVLFMDFPGVGPWSGAFTQAYINYTLKREGVSVLAGSLNTGIGVDKLWVDFGNAGSWGLKYDAAGNASGSDGATWATVREGHDDPTIWTVESSFILESSCLRVGNGTGITTFSTPEPISSSLFLLGAGTMGLKRLRRKKKVS